MPYQITLPDGSIGMIDDSVPRNRAMEAAEAAYPDAFPGIGEQLLDAPKELLKGFGRGFVDPVSGLLSTGYTGLRAAGVEMDPFAETAVGKGLAEIQESLAPEYEAAANLLAFDGHEGVLAKLDATASKSEIVGVKGYPTMLLFRGGENIGPYEGEVTTIQRA